VRQEFPDLQRSVERLSLRSRDWCIVTHMDDQMTESREQSTSGSEQDQ